MAELLTEEDTRKLPHWAKVAFAARCARRVLPLYRLPDDAVNAVKRVNSVNKAMELTEAGAANADAFSVYAADAFSKPRIVADFQAILSASQEGNWTDDTPVSQDVFGPMWPDGEPSWYREGLEWRESVLKEATAAVVFGGGFAAKDTAEPPGIELFISPGNASSETIQAVLDALSDLHIAAGGMGLEYVADDMLLELEEHEV